MTILHVTKDDHTIDIGVKGAGHLRDRRGFGFRPELVHTSFRDGKLWYIRVSGTGVLKDGTIGVKERGLRYSPAEFETNEMPKFVRNAVKLAIERKELYTPSSSW